MILYNCRSSLERDSTYILTKWDDDMNVESSYETSLGECNCPAGVRSSCRHRQMLPHFIATARVDTDWFFCFDDQSWHQPYGEADLSNEVEVTEEELAQPPREMISDPQAGLPKGHSIVGDSAGLPPVRALTVMEMCALPQYMGVPIHEVDSIPIEAEAFPRVPASAGEGGPAVVPSPAPFRRRV